MSATQDLKAIPKVLSWAWIKISKRNLLLAAGATIFVATAFGTVKPLPAAHYALVVNRSDGKVIPGKTYDGTEVVFLNPFKERIVVMRRNPIKKRFIKEKNNK